MRATLLLLVLLAGCCSSPVPTPAPRLSVVAEVTLSTFPGRRLLVVRDLCTGVEFVVVDSANGAAIAPIQLRDSMPPTPDQD